MDQFQLPSDHRRGESGKTFQEKNKGSTHNWSVFFSSYQPVVKSNFVIITGPGVTVKPGIYNEKLIEIRREDINKSDGSINYVFSAENIEAINLEDNGPDFTYLSPSVYLTIANYQTSSGETKNVLSSLDDLFNWYNGFVKDLAIEEDVKILASEIVNESDSESEKVRKIFYWVQENVKYIAFEQGMRGFIPHPAAYVMNKRYGDCKDMSSLLVGLLRSVGIDANYTWIGSRDLPYSYLEIPSPIVDNHMIASVEIDGSRVFLDATGNYTPLGFPTSMIQGKECLVNKGDSYEIVSVPVIEKERNQMIDTSEVWIEDGNLFGRGRTYLTGLAKVANTYKMIQKTQKKEDDYIRRLLSRGSNKFFLDFHEVFNLDDLDKEIEVVHEFRVEDYYKEVNDRVYVNLCLDKSLLNDLIKDREVPKENDYKYINRSVTHFQIPEGYVVSDVPQNSSGDFEVFGYSITYVSEAERLTVTKDFFVDYLLLEVDQFDQWNKGIKEYSKAIRNAVALNKTTKQ